MALKRVFPHLVSYEFSKVSGPLPLWNRGVFIVFRRPKRPLSQPRRCRSQICSARREERALGRARAEMRSAPTRERDTLNQVRDARAFLRARAGGRAYPFVEERVSCSFWETVVDAIVGCLRRASISMGLNGLFVGPPC